MGNRWGPGCCDCDEQECACEAIPLSLTFSGATRCLDPLNATFAVTPSEDVDCAWGYFEEFSTPESPCEEACPPPEFSDGFWLLRSINVGIRYYDVSSVEAFIETLWDVYNVSSCNLVASNRRANALFRSTTCDGDLLLISTTVDSPSGYVAVGLPWDSCTVGF